MKKSPFLVILLTLLASCEFNADFPRITTTLYPAYYAAKTLVGTAIEVNLLLPIGLDPHAFEPSPNQVISLMESELVFYASPALEPWVLSLAHETPSATVFFDLSSAVSLIASSEDPLSEDPHFWLDPISYLETVEAMAEIIIQRFPSFENTIEQNLVALQEEILRVDLTFENLANASERNTIIFAGHYVFGYWKTRYGIQHLSPYEGFSSETLPSAESLLLLVEAMESLNTQVIYASELEGTQAALAIQEYAPEAVILNLETLENASLEDRDMLLSYEQVMGTNIEALKIGLGYTE